MKIYNGMMRKEQIIYMKIKRNLLIGFCSILLFNCSGETYVGELSTDDDAPLVEPVPILLSLGMSDFQILTRGSGEVNNGNDATFWDNVRFYVYAFNKDPQTDLSKPWSEVNEDFCLLDGHRGGKENAQSSDHGKEVGVKKEDSNLMLFYPDEDSQKIYYNMKNTNQPYNFFAYYLDDWKSECHREKDHIYYDVEIDGRRDFMSARAIPETQKDKYEGNPYRDKIMERAFSAYSANHGLNPVFQLEHHLVLLRFVVCRPDETSDGYGTTIPELDSDLKVNKIEIKSKLKGRFTVAVSDPATSDKTKPKRGISFDVDNQEYPYFELKKKNGEPIGADGWCRVADCPRYTEEDIKDDDKKYNRYVLGKENKDDNHDSGTSLLVAPTDSYWAKISLSVEKEQDARYNTVDVELKNKGGKDVFSAGSVYTIYLTINSLSNIESTVEAGKWSVGGDVNLTPDDE
nr:fimbrillin family protein [Bacteroides acidifaciens]